MQAKTEMLDNLLEIEVAYNLLRDEAAEDKTKNPIDANYEKLNTNIAVSVGVYSVVATILIYEAVFFNVVCQVSLVRTGRIV